jgi:hypothetical protein
MANLAADNLIRFVTTGEVITAVDLATPKDITDIEFAPPRVVIDARPADFT